MVIESVTLASGIVVEVHLFHVRGGSERFSVVAYDYDNEDNSTRQVFKSLSEARAAYARLVSERTA
jgi:hypothetical protein